MKWFILILAFLTSLLAGLNSVQAQLSNEISTGNKNEVAAAVTAENAQGEKSVGIISVDTSVKDDFKSIDELRNRMVEMSRTSYGDSFKATTLRFAPDSMAFFFAIGAVTFNNMWLDSAGDPLAMERHILSLKDPVSHLSFYTFMQANGFYTNFHLNKLAGKSIDQVTHMQMMRRLNYQGMAVGSFASSVVADLGSSIQSCVNKWMKGKTDPESLQSCDEAWKQWTFRKKTNQYFPQIISLWSSQAITDMVESKAMQAFVPLKNTNLVKAAIKSIYKINKVEIVVTLLPGKKVSSYALKFAGSVTKFAFFVSVDHLVNKYIIRGVNNILNPVMDQTNNVRLQLAWQSFDNTQWDMKRSGTRHATSEQLAKNFGGLIESYSENMQTWRNHLTADLDMQLGGWMEMTKKVLYQVDYAHEFYTNFISYYNETNDIRKKVTTGEYEASALKNIPQYPFRALPFFGVRPGEYKSIANDKKIEDYYLTDLVKLEEKQRNQVELVRAKYAKTARTGFNEKENKILNEILEGLNGSTDGVKAEGLQKLVKAYKKVKFDRENTGNAFEPAADIKEYSAHFAAAILGMMAELGNPNPVMYPLDGFSHAVSVNEGFKSAEVSAGYSSWSLLKKYKFNKASDIMVYNLICGKSIGSLNYTRVKKIDIFAPEFTPPSLLNANADRNQYCQSFSSSNNMYNAKIGSGGVSQYIIKNMNSKLLSSDTFDAWWGANVSKKVNKEIGVYDVKYRELVQKYMDAYNNKRSFVVKAMDALNFNKTEYPTGLKAALELETNVYLQLINRGLMASAYTTEKNPVRAASALASQPEFRSIYKKSTEEVKQLGAMFKQYHALIQNYPMNRKNYVAVMEMSKKTDEMINDILVIAGYKKVAQAKSQEESFDLLNLFENTEVTSKQYTDVKVLKPTIKQQTILSAVKGLRQVESELKKLLRMKAMLADSLELDNKEMNSALAR